MNLRQPQYWFESTSLGAILSGDHSILDNWAIEGIAYKGMDAWLKEAANAQLAVTQKGVQ